MMFGIGSQISGGPILIRLNEFNIKAEVQKIRTYENFKKDAHACSVLDIPKKRGDPVAAWGGHWCGSGAF